MWVNCNQESEKRQLAACNAADSSHVVVRILPHAVNEQLRYRTHVLGTATLGKKGDGFFCYVFYAVFNGLVKNESWGIPSSPMFWRTKSVTWR